MSWFGCLLLLMAFTHSAFGALLDSDCDWSDSSSAPEDGSSIVHKVDLRCLSGVVTWHSQSGGLRVTFHAPPGHIGVAFEVCLLVQNKDMHAFQEHNLGLRVLTSQFTRDEQTICVQSHSNGKVILYFEPRSQRTASLRFDYELEINGLHDHSETTKSKKCSNKELASSYCSSDFAVEGTIGHFNNDANYKSRQIDVIASHVYHQSAHIFKAKEIDANMYGIVTAPWHFELDKRHKYILIGNMTQRHGAYLTCYAKHRQWENIAPTILCQ